LGEFAAATRRSHELSGKEGEGVLAGGVSRSKRLARVIWPRRLALLTREARSV